jgi:hypothetical protein
MLNLTDSEPAPIATGGVSPLMLADRLITLAQDADRAGYSRTADRLLKLVNRVFDEGTRAAHA